MKRTWSVFTIPYLVLTFDPSTIGRRSRCTPSRETSGPCPPSRPAILSISSMKMIPAFWARSSASRVTRSMSTRRPASSSVSSSSASFTLSFRFRFLAPPPSMLMSGLLPSWLIMSLRPCAMSSMPGAMMGMKGMLFSATSTSTSSSSSVPARSCARALSRPPVP